MAAAGTASGLPDEIGVFKGLSKAPLHFQNLVAELIDNALGAAGPSLEVNVDISHHPSGGDLFVIQVGDNGPGISEQKLKTDVFALGRPPTGGSHLNEHGYGLKNVLAKAQELSTEDWFLRTRDGTTLAGGEFLQCRRPLKFSIAMTREPAARWPAIGSTGTGTVVEFIAPMTYLQTVALGRRGALPRDPGRVLDYLREHLGVFYRGYFESGIRATTRIQTSLDNGVKTPVEAVSPDYRSKDTHTIGPITLGAHRITIEGELGVIDPDSAKTRQRLLYYRHAPGSQGVDVRLGNRVIATRLLSEIWNVERHPTYNAIAGEFRVPAIPGISLPTLNNKTSLDFDSSTWDALAEAILVEIPADRLPQSGGKSEDDLRDELFSHMVGLKRAGHSLEKEVDCGNGVFVDIIWDQTGAGGPLEIYEVKKGKAAPLAVYQLVMYWDALVSIGKQPTRAFLVAGGASASVSSFITLVNSRVDANGRSYALSLDDWGRHGITP